MRQQKYFTTTLPYVNAKPHIGHAKEFLQADIFNRFYQGIGCETFLNTGTDEHGLKIYRKAQEEGLSPEEYCRRQAQHFIDLAEKINMEYDAFTRTSDESHVKAAQEFWKICDENGYIYKKHYKIKYCVGCELEKTDSELEDGKCPDHPNLELEIIDEENYFFKFSELQKKLLDLYEKNPGLVKPEKRFREIASFVERGLEDFSISRIKEKMPWGIEVPGDSSQVMYVWFDALVNYISTIGWPADKTKFQKWWPAVQFCGKDNLRQQSAMWQAMLMAAGIENSEKIYVNGFVTVEGQKMSKTVGNVIDPLEMVKKFGTDGARYLMISMGSFGEDADTSWEKLIEKYNADLANGLGNLASRILKLSQKIDRKNEDLLGVIKKQYESAREDIQKKQLEFFEGGRLEAALQDVMKIIKSNDRFIEEQKPWELAKSDKKKFEKVMVELLADLYYCSQALKPFMPESSEKLEKMIKERETEILFSRAD